MRFVHAPEWRAQSWRAGIRSVGSLASSAAISSSANPTQHQTSRNFACAFQWVSPTRQPLQPEAIGAVMGVTKWLKPSISVSRNTVTARVCRP